MGNIKDEEILIAVKITGIPLSQNRWESFLDNIKFMKR